jgi:pyruvate dehydrogenase E2 component (dihydrolipoamide acetyltransferase)
MPALGMAQETGVLLEWLKSEGDEVTMGEPLMEIETDKATVEVEAPASGILANLTAAPGDEVPVGQVIGLILAPGESAPPATAASVPTTPAQPATPVDSAAAAELLASPLAARMAAEHQLDLSLLVKPDGSRIQKEDVLAYLDTQQQSASAGRVLASPKARRLAAEQDLDLTKIKGSGPQGAVVTADVEATGAQPIPALPPISQPQTLPVTRMWQTMVERLSQSWTTVPHFYLTCEVNASQLVTWWHNVQQRATEKITITDLLVKLVAAALRHNPRLNAMWHNNAIVLNDEINVGLAVAVEDGLLVPVIHQADQLGLNELAVRRRELVARAKAGRLALDDLRNGTFTLSNLGMYGIDAFNAIINPPQAAILAVGRISERVVPVDDQPAVQSMMNLTLSCDHRVVDGARGAQFLQTLVSFIEEPLAVLD